jgi:hypothetical protein
MGCGKSQFFTTFTLANIYMGRNMDYGNVTQKKEVL